MKSTPRSIKTIMRRLRAKRTASGNKAPPSDQRSAGNVFNLENLEKSIPALIVRPRSLRLSKFSCNCDRYEKKPTTPLYAGRLKLEELRSFGAYFMPDTKPLSK